MPGYTSDLYNYIVGLDPTFKNDVSLEQFKSKMSDTGYSKNMYDWIGQSDKTFHSDVSFDAFREKLGYKKKGPTVSPSVQKPAPISSGTQPKVTQKPSATSVSQKDKDREGFYTLESKDAKVYTGLPGKEKTQYRVLNNKWQRRDESGWRDLDSKNSIDLLNTYFNKTVKSISDTDQIYTGLVGKEENQYRVYNDNWQRLTPNSNNWEEVNSEGAISYLNKSYGKNVKVKPTAKKEDKGYQFTDINSQLISKTEEKVVPYLQRQYGKLGFNFEESGLGTDYVKVTSKNGNTIEVSLDENNPEEALKLKSFLQGNKSYQTEAGKKIERLSNYLFNPNLDANQEKNAAKRWSEYKKSNEYVNDLKSLSYEELEDQINKNKEAFDNRLFGALPKEKIKIQKEIDDYYNSDAYKVYKQRRKENANVKSDEIDNLYYELKQAKSPEEKKKVKVKIDSYLSKKIIDKQSDNYNLQLGDVSKSYKKLNAAISQFDKDKADLDQRVSLGNISQEEYESLAESINKRAEYLDSRRQEIKTEKDKLISDMNKLQSITGQYLIDKEKTGSFAGNMLNSFVSGLDQVFRQTPLVSGIQKGESLLHDRYETLSPEEKDILKGKGYNKQEIEQYIINKNTLSRIEDLKTKSIETFGTPGTTQEYMKSKDRGFFEKSISGVFQSLPGMIMPGGAMNRISALSAQAYSSIEEEMLNDKDFETTSALDRSVVAIPYAIGMGVLENLGVSTVMSKNPLAKSLITKSLLSAVGKVGGDASKEVIESVINKEIKSNIAKFGIRIVGGTLAEAETGALQSAVLDIGLKKLYNTWKDANDGKTAKKLTEGEYFSTPNTFMEGLSQVTEDAAAEAIGGWAMTTVGTSAQAIMNKGKISLYNEKDVEFLKGLSTDPEVKKMFIAKLKANMLQGSMTKSEAQEQLDALNNLESTFGKIPDNITGKNLKESVGLIAERDNLTNEIQGKDESLTAVQRARISEINTQLSKISENATKESNIEEVTAEGGGLQREGAQEGQPEVGQGEGTVGETTQQGTDLGNRPVEGRGVQELGEEATQEVNTYIAELGANERIGGTVDSVITKMNNAEYINDSEINSTIDTIFNEVESINNDANYSDQTKKALSDKLMNIAEQLDNYEFRTKTETVAVTQRGTAPSVRKAPTTKVNAEKFFEGQTAEVNGVTATFKSNKGRTEAVMDNGETVVLDTPTMIINEGDFEFDDAGALTAVTVTDRFGTTAKFTGDIAMDLAIKQRENQIGTVEQAEFDTVYKEVETNYIKAKAPSVEVEAKKETTATEVAAKETVEQTAKQEITPESYVEELNNTIESDPETYWSVSPVDLETAKDSTIVGDSDGKGIVSKDGDIKGVFKSIKSKVKGVADKILSAAVKAGGIKLDNFDGYLTKTYEKNGFRVVSRVPFNEEFAPAGWNKDKHGTPDVVAMIYDPERKLSIEEKTFSDYDEAMAYRDSFVEEARMPKKEGPTVEQEVEAIGQLLSGTDQEIDQKASKIVNKKIAKAVARAAKAVSKIIPGTKFVVHDTDESYRAATKEEGLKQSSNGEFNIITNTIHINGTSANARTVAHEVFHAILINKVGLSNAASVTKKMVEAISSKIDNNPELKKKLDNFLSNYEENIQNEEKLAELVGMLAENYNSMSASIKDIIARWIDRLAKIFGLDPFNRNETYDMLNTIARKVAKGKVISEGDVKIIEDVDNGESFESQYVSTNGSVVITPSNRKSKVVGTVVSESDLVDPKTLVGKPLEVFYYDNFTSSPYELKNRISGSTIKRVGEGGPGYSYRPEIKKAGIIAAFTNVTKVLNSIQGIRSRNDVAKDSAVVGVALQNKETGHLGNKTTERDFYSPSEGVIVQAINDKLLTENEAVEMLKGAVDAYAATSKGSDPKSSLGFTSNDFSTLDDFYKKIGAVSFERRGTFNAIAIPSKEDLKITKATKPYVVTWLNSGIPTLKEYFNATTEQYTKEAEAHDIVKYLDPALDKIGVDGSVTISEAEKNRAKSMGIEIETISSDLIHTSYPVVMFGKNIGVPTTFHSVRDMSKDWDVPNPFFKAGRRSDKATPIIIPEIKANEKKPATTRKQLSSDVSSKLTDDGKGNFVFHHYSKEKRGVIKPGTGQNIITGNEEGGALSAVGGLAMYYAMDNQVEPGVGNVQHTVLVPRDKVYDFNKDPDNFYDEAKKRFEAARPSQSFGNPNYQLAFVTQVANENGYDMVVAKWRNNELRAQTTMSLEPSKDNVPMKPIAEETYKVGDDVEVYGSKAKITSIDGDIISYKGEGVSGGINFKRFPKNISKQITPRKQIAEEVAGIEETIDPRKQKADTISGMVFTARQNGFSDAAISQYLLGKGYTQEQIDGALSAKAGTKNIDDIFEASEQEIRDKVKRKSIREFFRALTRTTLNRQVDIKRALAGLKNKQAQKALSRLITKAGASGLASIRFKIAAKDIYGKLKEADIKILDRIIYARRIISINENRAMKGLEPYRGMSGYSEVNAQQDLNDIKNEIGEEKFNDLNERAGKYFDVFKKNLEKLKDSGRISKEVYNDLNEIEYSPIATIKYIISDNIDVTDMDREASRLGISKEDIKKLTDRNENGIITDSRYLLAMNISSVESRAFENAMLNEVVKALDEATTEQQVALSEYVVFDNPIIGSFKDGRPKRKYDDQAVPNGFKKVYYFENGIEKYIIVREDMARQLLDVKNSKVQAAIENTAKTVPVVGTALKTITLTPARLLRFFATGGNPLFILGNVAVDWVNAVFNTDVYSNLKAYGMVQAGLGFAKNFIKKAVTNDTFNKTYNEFAEHGGLMDFLSNESMRALNELKPGHKIFSPLHKVVEMYGTVMSFLGETSEIAMRLAVYEKMKSNLVSEFKKENGVDPNAQQMDDIMWEAAREARELIDFNQGGSWAKEADVVMPYLNAALQGFRKPLEYAKKNPVGFASSYIQLAGMGASIAAMSLAAAMNAMPSDDDDEEKKKKIRKALDSISDHEKASYHIIFTGKVDKNGELEYIRIKKLPVASVATTLAEQMMYKYLVDYKFDEATFDQTIEKSLPFSISELESKNPVVSGFITYKYNEDTFTGEEVFRGPKDKVILKTAEGINDPKIESFYKSVAPALGLSPARSKAFVEKIITNQSTNPTINIFYAAANGMFGKDTQFGTEFSTAMEKMKEAAGKKLIRYTNENVLKYKKEDELEKEKVYITTEKYLKDSKIKADIKSRYNEGKTMTVGELIKIVKENYEPIDQERYFNKYYTYTQTMNTNPALLDLLYEDDPNIQALMINDMYGPNLDKEEMNELGEVMNKSRMKVSNKAWYIYQNKYKNRK